MVKIHLYLTQKHQEEFGISIIIDDSLCEKDYVYSEEDEAMVIEKMVTSLKLPTDKINAKSYQVIEPFQNPDNLYIVRRK